MSSATLLNPPAAYMMTDGGASQFVSPFPHSHFGIGTHQYFATAAGRSLRGDIPPFFAHPAYSSPSLEFSGYAPGHYGNVPFSESK
jgi:hypothetical protein